MVKHLNQKLDKWVKIRISADLQRRLQETDFCMSSVCRRALEAEIRRLNTEDLLND